MSSPARRSAKEICYPEVGTTGFTRVDGTVEFYSRINALIDPHMTVLDFGAGRGLVAEDPVPFRRSLGILRGKVSKVVGVDVDEAVLKNPILDQAFVVPPNERLPLEDQAVDLIISDHTFEHVTDPRFVAGELNRVLKPGGWLCARTPNKWGYIGIGARLVPNRLHTTMLARLQPSRQERDVFPTVYRLNSYKAVNYHFPKSRWDNFSYVHTSEPHYAGNSLLLWRLMMLGFNVIPEPLGATLLIFLRKLNAVAR